MNNNNYNIKNVSAYFNKVIEHIDAKEGVKQSQIEKAEFSIEELTGADFEDNFDMEKELTDRDLLAWIDLIDNQKLHAAVKSLSKDEQILLSYIFEKGMTQRELGQLYNLDQSTLSRRYNKIINSIKETVQTNDF